LPSPEEVSDFDKELALVQLVGYLELAAEKMTEVRQQLDDLAEVMKKFGDDAEDHEHE
jgi:hypothetical protein